MTTPPDFYGVVAEGVVEQTDTITLSHTTPAALSKTGIVSYPSAEVAGASPTADVITVYDVTTATKLVLGTDYTLTASGAGETLTYTVTRIATSVASADGNTAHVTYRWGTIPDTSYNFGEFQGTGGPAPTGTAFEASNQDTEGASAGGLGSGGGYGSLTDPANTTKGGYETGAPGSEYTVTPTEPSAYGWPAGAPDTEAVYGGGLPETYTPTDTSYTATLDTTAGGGSALVAGLGTPPAYRAPSSGVAATTKDTTLTDILGNQSNANASSPPSGYAAAQVDTSYVGAPAEPTSLSTQADAVTAAQAGTAYYLSQQGIVPSSIVVTDTTTSTPLVAGTDYAVTTAGQGATTVAYITLTAGTNFTAGNNISIAYSYGDVTYWDSNPPASVPAVPGTPSVAAVNRGIKATWSAPAGTVPIDYYLLQAEDLGTMYVPVTGQPVMDGQPAPSGGATTGEPTYQADTFTNLLSAALAAPAAPTVTASGSGSTVAAGTSDVKVTYVNANGETVASASASVTPTAGQDIVINSPAASGSATGWYAYVTQAAGSVYARQQAAGSPTAIGTNLTLTAPPTTTGANPPAVNTTLPTTSKQGVLTPGTQLIVRDLTSSEGDPMQPDGTVLEYGYDYTVTQIGVGPWAQFQISLLPGSVNAKAGDTIVVEYWWGADPASVSATFTQGLMPNTPIIYKPDGTTYGFQGYRFRVAAVNKAGISNYSPWSPYAVPLNYNAPQPGHQGTTQTELTLDPANTVNPIYLPDGTVKAGTGLGG